MMSDLLTVLSDAKPFSLPQLSAILSCSEAELMKQIVSLQQQGINLAVEDKQVQLIPELALLNADYLARELSECDVFVRPVIPSTNQFLLEHINQLEKGSLCLAEYQSAGRGRRGRQWLSPFAGQVIMSLYWTLPRHIDLNGLSLVVGMAIADVLTQLGAEGIGLKWPNDILLKGRKLAGVLIEIDNKNNQLHNIIIGAGINLSLGKQAERIDQPWAELVEALPTLDRNQLIVLLVKKLSVALQVFEQTGIDQDFQQKWAEFDAFLNAEVQVISENHRVSGIEQGIDQRGYIQLMTEQGMRYFNGGAVSLRKKS